MAAKILVTGATGNVGSEVVKELTGKVPFRVGASRVEAARRALGADCEIVPFDFLNPATFAPAFSGIEKLFLVRPPILANVKRDIAPALYAAKAAGVQHIVFLSLQGVDKNQLAPHYKIEKLILELGFSYTFLRASFFMQNLNTTHQAEIRDRSEIAVPVGKAKTSFIDVRDIAAVAARALIEDGHQNQMYTLTGSEALDYEEISDILSFVLGRRVQYTNPSAIAFLRSQLGQGKTAGFALVVTALYTITRFGNAKTVTSDVRKILGRQPITFIQYAQDYRQCWIPEQMVAE